MAEFSRKEISVVTKRLPTVSNRSATGWQQGRLIADQAVTNFQPFFFHFFNFNTDFRIFLYVPGHNISGIPKVDIKGAPVCRLPGSSLLVHVLRFLPISKAIACMKIYLYKEKKQFCHGD